MRELAISAIMISVQKLYNRKKLLERQLLLFSFCRYNKDFYLIYFFKQQQLCGDIIYEKFKNTKVFFEKQIFFHSISLRYIEIF